VFIILSGGAALNSTLKERFLAVVPKRDDPRRHGLVGGRRPDDAGGDRGLSDVTTGTFYAGPGFMRRERGLHPRARPPGPRRSVGTPSSANVSARLSGRSREEREDLPGSTASATRCPATAAASTPDGIIEMLVRDSVTINSGGEKISAEEVEAALGITRTCTTP